MKRYIPLLFFGLIPLYAFPQSENEIILEAKTLFYKGHNEGDYTGRKKADSLLYSLLENSEFTSVKNEIITNLYIINLRLGKTPAKDLEILNSLIEKYHKNFLNDPDLLARLNYFKQRMRVQLNEEDSEKALLEIIKEQENSISPNDTLLGYAYDFLGREYYNKKQFPKSASFGKKSINHYQKANLNQLYIASIQATGAAFYNYDKIDSSLYFMKKAYQEIKKNNSPNYRRLAQLSFNIAIIKQGKTGEFREAESFFKEAIRYDIKAHGDESATLITYYSLLSDNFLILKDLEQAEFYANKAYVLANDILKVESVYLRSFPSMSLSKIHIAKKDFETARSLIDQVVEESVNFFGENDKFTVQAFIDKAVVEFSAQNYIEAETYFLRAAQASESIDRVYSKVSSYSSLTEMFLKTKNFKKALYYSKKSKELIDLNLVNDYKTKITTNIPIVKAYIGLDKLERAQVVLDTIYYSLNNSIAKKELETELLALENEILLKKYLQEPDDAILEKAYTNVKKMIQQIISGRTTYNYQDSKIFYSQSIIPFINTSLEICHLKNKQNEDIEVLSTIFKLMEINKSSILLDGIIDFKIKIEKGVPPQLIEKEAYVKSSLLELREAYHKLKNDSTTSPKKINLLLDNQLGLNSKLDSIQEVLKIDFPEYYNAKNLVEAQSIEFYQSEVLKKGQCVVEYYINEETLYRLVITKTEILFEEFPESFKITKQIEGLLRTIQNKEDISALSKELGKKLLPDFSKDIKEIIFITDGSLSKIPFEILDYNNNYLLQDFHISYAGSLQLYQEQVALHKKRNIRLKWMGFAPEYKDKSLSTNKKEVSSIASLTRGEYRLGKEATKQNFLNTATSASIIHLATHAELDNINPMLNKMIFYDNGEDAYELTAAEIYGLDLKANLAVLSACETGSGIYETDGVMSMSRAFAYAGVPSTVMSLWKVPDAQTSMIMISFYENLDKGQQKNEALKNAKLSYLETIKQPELKHPYYWAGFVVTGDITPIHNGNSIWWYVFAIVLVLILIVFIFKRKK